MLSFKSKNGEIDLLSKSNKVEEEIQSLKVLEDACNLSEDQEQRLRILSRVITRYLLEAEMKKPASL